MRDAIAKTYIKRGEKGNLLLFDVSFDEDGQNPHPKGVFTQVFKKKMELIYPDFAASKKPVFPVPRWAEENRNQQVAAG